MVNWREDVEFCYVMFMLISGIVVFFGIYDRAGTITAAEGTVGLVIFYAIAGFIAFETDWAMREWEKLGKKRPK